MPNNEDKLLDGIFKIQAQNSETLIKIGETQTDVAEIKTQVKQLNGTVKKHESVIYGNPEKMGEGGLLFHQTKQDAKITSIKRDITVMVSGIVLLVTTSINMLLAPIFNAVKSWFVKGG